MSISSVKLEDTGSDQERALGVAPVQNGPSVPALSDSSEVAVLREENCRLMTTLLEYKKMLENTKLRYGSVKKDYYAAKKRLKRLADKLGQSGAGGGDSESRESTPTSCVQQQQSVAATPVDDEIRKKWKEPNVKAALKLKAAIGVAAYQSLIRDGELSLPSLRTMSRYVDALKRAGLKPNYDFNVRDDGTDLAGGRMFEDEDDEDSGEVDHNRNQQQPGGANKQHLQQQSREGSDVEDPVNFTAVPDISYYRGKMEVDDTDDMDDDDQPELYQNGERNGGVEVYRPHPNQHTVHQQQQQQQTLTSGHIEFLKQMTGFRKKWTPFELRTCMDIRRIIGSKEYDSLRKNDGMPLPSAKTLRKYKHTVHLDGVDVMSRKRNFTEMVDGVVPGVPNGNGINGMAGYGNDADDILNAEEPEGFFDINGLTEEQIDFLQSLSSNTKGFSDFELQKTLELKNELGGHNYEILRKQECLHVPTLAMLQKYEQENGLEDLSAMVVVEDVDEEDDQEPEQEPELDQDYDNEFPLPSDHFGSLDMMNGGGGTGEDSHMGIFEHHSIFDRDDASSTTFDMGKLSQQHVEFLNTLPENPKRWTTDMINSALDIKNEIGTRDYELLRRQGIPLPAARTLRRHKDIKTRVEGDVV